jgi:hypothetical protein
MQAAPPDRRKARLPARPAGLSAAARAAVLAHLAGEGAGRAVQAPARVGRQAAGALELDVEDVRDPAGRLQGVGRQLALEVRDAIAEGLAGVDCIVPGLAAQLKRVVLVGSAGLAVGTGVAQLVGHRVGALPAQILLDCRECQGRGGGVVEQAMHGARRAGVKC